MSLRTLINGDGKPAWLVSAAPEQRALAYELNDIARLRCGLHPRDERGQGGDQTVSQCLDEDVAAIP